MSSRCDVSPRLCRAGTLITDVGSTKEIIVERSSNKPPQTIRRGGRTCALSAAIRWPATRKSGSQHAEADLFVGRIVIVTPSPRTRPGDTQAVSRLLAQPGRDRCCEMSASEHDRALAATSHLPHLVAAAIAASTPEEYVTLTASGWQDTTRIAAGDPVVVAADHAGQPCEPAWPRWSSFSGRLDDWRQALEADDGPALERLLTEAKRIRDAVGS